MILNRNAKHLYVVIPNLREYEKPGKKHSEMLKVLGVVTLPMDFSCLYIFLFPKYFPPRMVLFQNTSCSFHMHASASGQLETHCIEFMVIPKCGGPSF